MKQVFQKILPASKESASAKLRRNNPPAMAMREAAKHVTAAEITDSEDDDDGSSGDETSPAQRRAGAGGGVSGGGSAKVPRSESFEELMVEYQQYEREATASSKLGAGRPGGVAGSGRQVPAKGKRAARPAAGAAADEDEDEDSDERVPLGQVRCGAEAPRRPPDCIHIL